MNPIPTLRLCARLGYAALALLSPELALLLSPALELSRQLAPAAPGAIQA